MRGQIGFVAAGMILVLAGAGSAQEGGVAQAAPSFPPPPALPKVVDISHGLPGMAPAQPRDPKLWPKAAQERGHRLSPPPLKKLPEPPKPTAAPAG